MGGIDQRALKVATVEINIHKPHVLDFKTTRRFGTNLGRIGKAGLDGGQLQSRHDATLFPRHFAPEIAKRVPRLERRLIHLRVVTGTWEDGTFGTFHDDARSSGLEVGCWNRRHEAIVWLIPTWQHVILDAP